MAAGTLPPDLTTAACGHHLRGKAAIQSGVPLCGYRWFRSGQVIEARQNSLVGTIGATAAAHCAGGDDRLIAVVLFAVPPCLPVAVSGDGIRGQGTVSLRIPLLCQFWVLRSQIVEPRQNLLPGTDRATGSGDRPGRDGGLPPVPQRAPPPNLAARFSRDLFRRQSTIFLYIPFLYQPWELRGQIVLTGLHQPASADRAAAAAGDPGIDLGPPGVSFLTNPPRKVVASRREFRRLSRGIFPRIPLDSKIRVQRCKVIVLSQFFTGAVRTAASGGTGIDRCLPGMAASAPPPGHGMTTVGHPIRHQREIFLAVPFLQ